MFRCAATSPRTLASVPMRSESWAGIVTWCSPRSLVVSRMWLPVYRVTWYPTLCSARAGSAPDTSRGSFKRRSPRRVRSASGSPWAPGPRRSDSVRRPGPGRGRHRASRLRRRSRGRAHERRTNLRCLFDKEDHFVHLRGHGESVPASAAPGTSALQTAAAVLTCLGDRSWPVVIDEGLDRDAALGPHDPSLDAEAQAVAVPR